MTRNDIIQWSVVAIILLIAIIWITVKAIRLIRNKGNSCNCGSCGEATDCKARELRQQIDQCTKNRDGQSARN